MAAKLINCPACGGRMWVWRETCPQCGFNRTGKIDPGGLGVFLALAGVLAMTLGVVKIAFLAEGLRWAVAVVVGAMLLWFGVQLFVRSER